jgi:hypothetical protein
MKEKAAAREAALKLTVESAGGSCAAVFGLIEATGMFSEIKIIELLTASEIDHGLAKSVTYRAPGA